MCAKEMTKQQRRTLKKRDAASQKEWTCSDCIDKAHNREIRWSVNMNKNINSKDSFRSDHNTSARSNINIHDCIMYTNIHACTIYINIHDYIIENNIIYNILCI